MLAGEFLGALRLAAQAILPLCGFLFITLLLVLRERLRRGDEIALGVALALVGMALFALGLAIGLTPLGTQLGSNIPVTFAGVTFRPDARLVADADGIVVMDSAP